MPRRARQLVPAGFPHGNELVASIAVLIVLVHLLLAQLTLVLTVVFALAGKISRWRLWWLITPAAAGLAWMLAAGPAEALAGFTAGPSSILGHLPDGTAARSIAHPLAVFSGASHWLPRQLPAALPLAAAEAAVIGWLGWLHTDEWAVPAPRPGVVAALRAAVATRRIRSGGVVTRAGCALGVVPATGAVAGLSWAEASHGVLVTGAGARDVTLTGLQVVHAALRRRKPVIVLDDGHDAAIAHALAAACRATATPLRHDHSTSLAGDAMAVDAAGGASRLWTPVGAHAEGLRQPAGIDLGRVVRERSVALLPARSPESAADAVAGLAALCADLRRIGVDGDGLVWVPRGEQVPAEDLAALARDGAVAGLPVLIGTVSPAVAAGLAAVAGALIVHRITDQDLAAGLAARTGTKLLPAAVAVARGGPPLPASAEPGTALTACPAVEPRILLSLRPAEFVLAVSGPRQRLIAPGKAVQARLPRPGPGPAGRAAARQAACQGRKR